jgi:hypothetical protein
LASQDVKVFGNTCGYGKVEVYDEKAFVNGLDPVQLAMLYRRTSKDKEDEFDQMVHLSRQYNFTPDRGVAVEWIHAMSSFYSRAIQQRHYKLMFEQKLGFLQSYRQSVDEFLKEREHQIESGSMLGDSNIREVFEMLFQRLQKRYAITLFHLWSSHLKQPTFVMTESFERGYFHQMSTQIRGFIFEKEDQPDDLNLYANRHQMPIAITKHPGLTGQSVLIQGLKQVFIIDPQPEDWDTCHLQEQHFTSPIKLNHIQLYATISDEKSLFRMPSNPTLSGVCVFKTEGLYQTKGTIPTIEEFSKRFTALFNDLRHQDIYIALPDIRPNHTIGFVSNQFMDIDFYHQYPSVIDHLIKGICHAISTTEVMPKMVIPMVRTYKEVDVWTTIIESVFEQENCQIPDIGCMMETESALEFHEDFKDLKFAIIGIDNLIAELDDHPHSTDSVTFTQIKTFLWDDLKAMHQFFRSYSISTKHIIMGEALANRVIFDKLIKAGFRAFALPLERMADINSVITHHFETRGKYRGVHEARKQKNHQIHANGSI